MATAHSLGGQGRLRHSGSARLIAVDDRSPLAGTLREIVAFANLGLACPSPKLDLFRR